MWADTSRESSFPPSTERATRQLNCGFRIRERGSRWKAVKAPGVADATYDVCATMCRVLPTSSRLCLSPFRALSTLIPTL